MPLEGGALPLPTRIALIGNHLPRQCGIATFTTDLSDAITREYPGLGTFVIPVNDPDSAYLYPDRVRLEIFQEDESSYERAAEFLNFHGNDLVCLQHEYGIYGGVAGRYILTLLRKLKMPLVTTLHTVLREPDDEQRAVLDEIVFLSDRVIVMSEYAAGLLRAVYGVPAEKIDLIPHGVPDLPFSDPNYFKDMFGTEGKQVLLTFGLLSPNKGIENVIRALPEILKTNRDVIYVVCGATHPHVLKSAGERYRNSLQRLAEELGVSSHVVFNNRFVSSEELFEQIGSADIYITPYRQEAQVVSGTLAIALGAGKAVISTPYWHARELLAEDRGLLVPFDDHQAIAEAVIDLLRDDAVRHAMRKRAYLYSRRTTWQKTAQAYVECFQHARIERMLRPRPALPDLFAVKTINQVPDFNSGHLQTMTDDTGILQHAIFSLPNYSEGYTTDDNARALIVAMRLNSSPLTRCESYSALARRYLAFLWLAFNEQSGRFRNFLSYGREWLEDVGSEDSHGRSLWALGIVLASTEDAGFRLAAGRLFEAASATALSFTSPRAWAFSILGMQGYLDKFPGDRHVQSYRNELANRLLTIYEATRSGEWHWFEKTLAYSNARLPQALLVAGSSSGNQRMVDAGLESLRWLLSEQHHGGETTFVPIGSRGFAFAAGMKARFDQQPVEACGAVSSCLLAYQMTGQPHWLEEAQSAFRWFLGENDLQVPLYDSSTGGCRDGLHPDRVNENQGAESTLSFLMALLDMQDFQVTTCSKTQLEMSVSR